MQRNIQALRAFAALLVIFVHLEALLGAAGLKPFGEGGVDLFFIISGFIMVHTTRTRPVTALGFLGNRLTRVAPLYWAMTLFVFGLAVAAPSIMQATQANPEQLVKSLGFVPFMRENGTINPTLFVGWTINYEMFFYAVFAAGLLFSNYLAGCCAAMLVIATLAGFGWAIRPHGAFATFYTQPIILEFVFGMVIALGIPLLPTRTNGWMKRGTLGVMALGLGGLFLVPHLLPHVPSVLTAGLPAALVVVSAIALERWGWTFNNALVLGLGNASYSIYLCHPFVTQVFQKLGEKLHVHGATALVTLALCLVSVAAVGMLLHRFVEKPLSTQARGLTTMARLGPILGGRRIAAPQAL